VSAWLRDAARSTGARLAFTVWLVYALHATTNVVRETYLAIAIGERFSLRVDEYLGLHPDLFEIPGRGAYINNNPGASFLGAVPYTLARPVLAALFAWRPALIAPKPPAAYDDPRPNRTRFMNESRARGLDVKLALAAIITQVGLMAPLGALAALLLFFYLRERGQSERRAVALALIYAFATPIFFRSGFLNQNAILAHCTLAAWVLMVGLRPRAPGAPVPPLHLWLAGLVLGYGLLSDYSAAALLLVFGVWSLVSARRAGWGAMIRAGAVFSFGASVPLAGLLAYQWAAFGSPWFPAQRYMPPTRYSVIGWNGFFVPTGELLVGNLFDPRYGLFAFCPLLIVAFAAPFIRRDPGDPTRAELGWILAASAALYVFSSANQFANLQWNTGVRYMVPAVPLLFLAAVPVLRRLPAPAGSILLGVTVVISFAVSMTRESVPDALHLVFTRGPTLPVFIVLEKMASGYPALQFGPAAPWILFAAVGLLLMLVWRRRNA
jgi:hypothetical protein